jgi:catalase
MGSYNIRDGVMSVNGNGGGNPNYEPNSLNGPKECKSYAISK